MTILDVIGISFPLKNPVLIFSVILFFILLSPLLMNRFKIPHLIGLILTGAIIGPNGLNIIERDSSIILFGTVGLIYIMFLAGLEMNLVDLKKNINKSLFFGLFTFFIPLIIGTLAGIFILNYSFLSSILLASMFSSQTLVAYPIVSKFGITRNRAATIAVGGTMVTDSLAMLLLTIVSGLANGELTFYLWIRLFISVAIFAVIVILIFPVIGRWFFKRYDDNVSQYIFTLGMVFLSSFLAQLAGIEAIIGAFLAGIVLNRLIPNTSPLMNRIGFVGNALFIPFFLIGIGMISNIKNLFTSAETIFVAVVITTLVTLAKFLATWFTQKSFRLTTNERNLLFGLSTSHAAATLAIVSVGYNIILSYSPSGQPLRLLDENVLNGTVLMILVTCTIAAFVVQKSAQKIIATESTDRKTGLQESDGSDRILIPLNMPENIEELVNLGIILKWGKNSRFYALHIVPKNLFDRKLVSTAKKLIQKAKEVVAATDHHISGIVKFNLNVVNGIYNTVGELDITDIIMGLHRKKGITDSFLGSLTEGILTKCNTTIYLYRSVQPLSTIKRYLVIVPDKAENESGFRSWLSGVQNIGKNAGSKLVFVSTSETERQLKVQNQKLDLDIHYSRFQDEENLLPNPDQLKPNDALIIVMAKVNSISYSNEIARIPRNLNRNFENINYILIYPIQYIYSEYDESDYKKPSEFEPLKEQLEKVDDIITKVNKYLKK